MGTPTNTCEDCRFFEADKEDETIGACRRYPPTIQGADAAWPPVDIDDWCGEYKFGGNS